MRDLQQLIVRPFRRQWDLDKLFAPFRPSDIPQRDERLAERKEKLWKDTYAEYDARRLQGEVMRRAPVRTPEADAFLAAWDEDEKPHTAGFVRLLELTSGLSPGETWTSLDARESDFTDIGAYLKDEFTILVTTAWDEIVTCRVYREDHQFYSE